ncbi:MULTISPECIES: Txe/YoeB family addiction module toxin [Photorhabdus]|uniref:Toxin YoeB n=1 Tax=Photorhabdus namnaonensis TaxID=1851568 RepID=A0A1B8YCV7_9GAMM|nr:MULTISPECIES: Txe/YoeB family addiction module toxin [Photorhabdus]KGM29802.1 toxin YoeB [Photorhabdus luminescens]MBS9427188.1 Txe/YoeB family addiction module toxin [Photorhabdus akhurstii]MCC8457541.1 Txe/YoeB family addiction module toxin [Photorhabdus aegyptia]OCA52973.1 Toxin YoeB [Photorhabdus namnaonensis]PQQ28959.1 Txe/YoeB family addiction module toxin [Photorhabdus luminescens]
MILSWAEMAWEDYLYWQQTDKKVLKRVNTLIKDIKRQPFDGLGDPEPLKHNWSGYWSRRINREHRLIYKVTDDAIIIVQCRYHY